MNKNTSQIGTELSKGKSPNCKEQSVEGESCQTQRLDSISLQTELDHLKNELLQQKALIEKRDVALNVAKVELAEKDAIMEHQRKDYEKLQTEFQSTMELFKDMGVLPLYEEFSEDDEVRGQGHELQKLKPYNTVADGCENAKERIIFFENEFSEAPSNVRKISEELSKSDDIAESDARRSDEAEEKLCLALKAIATLEIELTETKRQLHEVQNRIKDFEIGANMEDDDDSDYHSVGEDSVPGKIYYSINTNSELDNQTIEMTVASGERSISREAYRLVKCLQRAIEGGNPSKAWKALGRMSTILMQNNINKTQTTQQVCDNIECKTQRKLPSPPRRKTLSENIHDTILYDDEFSDCSHISNDGTEAEENVSAHRWSLNDDFINEFNSLVAQGEARLKSEMKGMNLSDPKLKNAADDTSHSFVSYYNQEDNHAPFHPDIFGIQSMSSFCQRWSQMEKENEKLIRDTLDLIYKSKELSFVEHKKTEQQSQLNSTEAREQYSAIEHERERLIDANLTWIEETEKAQREEIESVRAVFQSDSMLASDNNDREAQVQLYLVADWMYKRYYKMRLYARVRQWIERRRWQKRLQLCKFCSDAS